MILQYEQLATVLNYLKSVTTHKYFGNKVLFEQCELVSSEWLNYRRDLYAPPSKEDAVTFKECVVNTFYADEGKIYLELLVYDGDSYHGHPTNRRCKYVFCVPPLSTEKYIVFENIMKAVDYTMYNIAEREYEKNLSDQRKIKIRKLAESKVEKVLKESSKLLR